MIPLSSRRSPAANISSRGTCNEPDALAIKPYADLARLAHVTRGRITQTMNLLHPAPDIQEEILFLPQVTRGNDPIGEHNVRPAAACPYIKITDHYGNHVLAGAASDRA